MNPIEQAMLAGAPPQATQQVFGASPQGVAPFMQQAMLGRLRPLPRRPPIPTGAPSLPGPSIVDYLRMLMEQGR